MKTKLNILVVLALVVMLMGGVVTPVQAAAGDLDPTFGTAGVVETGVSDFLYIFQFAAPSVQQSDGKIVVGGFYPSGNYPQAVLERYAADGALDGDFGVDGRIYPQVEGSTMSYLVGAHIGSQDEIIAVGGYQTESYQGGSYLARYDSAGSPVAGFGVDGVLLFELPPGWQVAMPLGSAMQSDGKVLVAGYAVIANETGETESASFLMRLDPSDGTLDSTFGSGGVVLNYDSPFAFQQITLQSDGKILVASSAMSSSFSIYRFSATGAPDETFGTGGVFGIPVPFQCSALAEGPEGKLYLTAGPTDTTASGSDFLLVRLNADGSVDSEFGTDGFVTTDLGGSDESCSLLVQADGKVIVGGGSPDGISSTEFALARYGTDGTLDESFGSGGIVYTPEIFGVITELSLTPDGKLLATGQAYSENNSSFPITALARYDITETGDITAPSITPDIQGTLGQNGWYTSDVALSWTVEDAQSEVTSTSGCDDVSITADQQDTAYTCSATSAGGNNSVTVHIKRDATGPVLAPSVSPNPVVLNGSATASPNAADATSDLASASCDPVDTSSVGAHSVTCTATDNAGNTNTASVAYSVNYNFIGFSAPVDNNGVLNIAKAGQAIPLKWRITDANGSPVTNLTGVTVTAVSLSCTAGTSTDLIEEYVAGSSGLQNLGNGYYQWNWKSPTSYANSCKTLKLDMGEGFFHTALFQFKK